MTPAAELGAGTDPRALIPGAPETVEAAAAALSGYGRRVEQVGHGLRAVDVGGWRGDAGVRFAEAWAAEPPRWLRVADAIGLVGSALTGYAGTLRWAQGQAAVAIELWNRAEADTQRAAAEHARALEDAETGAGPAWVEPFTDPGEPLRGEARELLARARDRVRDAGDEAARVIGASGLSARAEPNAGAGPNGAGAGRAIGAPDPGAGPNAGAGPTAGVETSGPEFDLAAGELTFGSLDVHAHLFDASAAGGLHTGGLDVIGTAAANFGADGSVSAGLSKDGLAAEIAGSAGLRATAGADAGYGILHARAAGEAFAGADARAGVALEKDRIGVDLGAFAGGRVSGDLGADVAGIGVGAHGEAWAGLGAELDLGYEFTDGKFHIGGHAGAAVGVGASVGLDITVDPEEIEQTAVEAADAIGRGLREIL